MADLNPYAGTITGPARSLAVRKGDKVRLQVQARYEQLGSETTTGTAGVAAAILSAFGASAGVEGTASYQALQDALAGTALLAKDDDGVPHAYLNYLLFDANFTKIGEGMKQVTQAGAVTTTDPTAVETLFVPEIVVPENGYLYTYLSNNSNWNVSVYFDDFVVEHETHLVQVNDYYPFGARHDQGSYVADHAKYGYQGKELTADLNLNLLDFHARQYDPLLGRFHSSDPMATSYAGLSPFAGMANNPISVIDPDGREPITLTALLITAAISGSLNLGVQAAQGNIDNFGDGALAFGIGAAAGAAGGAAGGLVSGALGVTASATVGGGMAIGAASGLAGGFVSGAGNAWANGASFEQGLGAGAISGGVGLATGGVLGGIQGGFAQRAMNSNWQAYEYIRDGSGNLHYISSRGGANTHFIHSGIQTDISSYSVSGPVQIVNGPSSSISGLKANLGSAAGASTYHAVSFSANVVPGGGFNIEFGRVWGNQQSSYYLTIGPSVGLDASAGILYKQIVPRPGFNIDNYGGYGGSLEAGIGPVDVVISGGDNYHNAFGSSYGKTYIERGIGYSVGSPLGFVRNFGYTRLW